MTKLDINSIAIIGAGPGGLASLYEFLHTNKDGSSTVGGPASTNPRFSKIVAFEQKDKAGGIWAPSLDKADLPVPPQDVLDTEKYNDPDVIHPRVPVPENLDGATKDKPVTLKENKELSELEWRRSGVFPDLFTNIPARFTRFSYQDNEEKYLDKSRPIYPFLYHQELTGRFSNWIEKEKLYDHIRLNTTVEKVVKNAQGKWVITVREKNEESGKENWYSEEFDAVVLSNGHYTVPNIPHIAGLAEYNKKHPGAIVHAKSYRKQEDFADKNVLVIGGGISTVNLLQYIVPIAKKTVNSKRGKNLVFDWINDALISDGIVAKGEIEKIDPESGEVFFKDGTSEKDIDKIVLTTGYHYHYPFLTDYVEVVDPSNLSRVGGLYYNTFSVQDPTIGAVGVTVSTINFHTIEASAAALAGVWSGAKTLPTVQEQKKWEEDLIKERGNNLIFHYYTHDVVKEEYVDRLQQFYPNGRYNPLEFDGPFLPEIEVGIANLEKLFYGLKDKKLPKSATLLPQ
ncbi:flavin-containing monooxygenase [Scheffersomyces xylosifermentans]|uniref:flavin-containing monooxygenase n=1 Tax=Scheffersomyces xylosifermentans TaxID=1304137 RepID=UPI00315DC74B